MGWIAALTMFARNDDAHNNSFLGLSCQRMLASRYFFATDVARWIPACAGMTLQS
jgi:hypothetical protein